MLLSILGKKVGMTQIFDEDRNAVPVTVINVGDWYVTQTKSVDSDGYASLQVALLKKRYRGLPFSPEWLKKKKQFFAHVREVKLSDDSAVENYKVGQPVTMDISSLEQGVTVAVTGVSKGKGFQGVVKRWNFKGGPKTHGSTFHRRPGSIGMHCSQGKVIKGKKLPGHDGNRTVTVQGLRIVKYDDDMRCLFVKGAVPGKKNSLVHISKQR